MALMTPLIFSCKKEEVAGNSLEGKWNLLYEDWEAKRNGEIANSGRYNHTKGSYMEFKKEGLLKLWSSALKIETSYQVVNNRLLIANVGEDTDFAPNGYGIQKNGNTLILIEERGREEYVSDFEYSAKIYLEK